MYANCAISLPQWNSVYIDPSPTRRRPKPLRARLGAMVTDPKCRENPHIGDEYAGRAER